VILPSHALLMTAGLGTRLRPLSDVRAKPAMPIGGEAIVRRIVRWLVAQGVTDLVMNLHHRPETLTAVVGDGADLHARVRYSWEQPVVLGSAGGPRQALDIIGADPFFIVNGDVLTDASLEPLADVHARTGALVTLALVPNREFMKYSGFRLAADGSIAAWVAAGPEARGSFHFIGPQLVHREAFAAVRAGEVAQSVRGVYDQLIAARPGSVRGVVVEPARYWDIGSVADYWRTCWTFDEGSRSSTATVAATARVSRSIVWDGAALGDHAVIDRCIVTDGVIVPAHATYSRSILLRGANGAVDAQPLEVE
jgi:NDP-sugar pyrophosphorylase family protein